MKSCLLNPSNCLQTNGVLYLFDSNIWDDNKSTQSIIFYSTTSHTLPHLFCLNISRLPLCIWSEKEVAYVDIDLLWFILLISRLQFFSVPRFIINSHNKIAKLSSLRCDVDHIWTTTKVIVILPICGFHFSSLFYFFFHSLCGFCSFVVLVIKNLKINLFEFITLQFIW